jgi:hypothetical protein
MGNPKRRKEKKVINGGGNENAAAPTPEVAKPAAPAPVSTRAPETKSSGILDKVKSKLKSE